MLHKILLALLIVQFLHAGPVESPQAPSRHSGSPAQLPPLEPAPPGRSPINTGSRSEQALAIALDQIRVGDPQAAIQTLRPISSSSPSIVEVQRAQCLMGAALAMNGDLRTAEDGAGILNHPASVNGQTAWKQVLPECIRRLEEVTTKMPPERRSGLYYFLGIIGANEADHIRYLREAVKLSPDFSQAAYQLGVHLMGNGDLEEATAIFRRVAEQRPEWAEPRHNIGVALTLSGRAAEAIREFQEAVKISPEFAQAHGHLGLALYVTGDFDQAMTECGRALRGEPGNPLNHNCAALILLEKNRMSDAVAYARHAAKLAPTHETFQVVLAAALLGNGQEQEALVVARRALASEPRLSSDPARLEKAHLLRGRALALARQALQKAGAR